MKNNQSEMTEMNSTLERINISLNEAENRISNLAYKAERLQKNEDDIKSMWTISSIPSFI